MILFLFASPLLVILTINLLVDGDSERGMNYLPEIFMNFSFKSDSVQQKTFYYQPLPLTNNSWTLIDIRRTSRSDTLYPIWVNEATELNISNQENIKASNANRTVQSNILIYNRVPKCGSTSLKKILNYLAKKNSFKFESSQIFWREALRPAEEKSLYSYLTRPRSKFFFDRHFFIFDRDNVPDTKLNMINMIRSPVERIVSLYYYNRIGSRWRRKPSPPQEWFMKDIDNCVESGDLECQIGGGGPDMQLTYFCGSHVQCANNTNSKALQMAKYNLETRYSVVGLTEHFNTSLAVMERYLPAFFLGASARFNEQSKKSKANPHPTPSKQTM